MQCPFCGKDHDKVVDSRSSEGGRAVRRRRQCLACHKRFTTYERPEETVRLNVVKKDGSREPYDRQKVIVGLQKACYKRQVSSDEMRRIVDQSEEEIFRNFDRDVPSTFIGDTVAELLGQVDKVAYLRFASVYRDFGDVNELIDEAIQAEQRKKLPAGQKELFGENIDDE